MSCDLLPVNQFKLFRKYVKRLITGVRIDLGHTHFDGPLIDLLYRYKESGRNVYIYCGVCSGCAKRALTCSRTTTDFFREGADD